MAKRLAALTAEHYEIGRAWMRKDQLGMASKSLEMTAALNPTYASAYTLLGQTYRRLETAKSQTAFQKSHSLQEKEIQDMHDKLSSEQELSEQPSPKIGGYHGQAYFQRTHQCGGNRDFSQPSSSGGHSASRRVRKHRAPIQVA